MQHRRGIVSDINAEIQNECRDLLAKWDAGEIVWTVEMGGLGPGYEQCIQITAFEALRFMLDSPPDWDSFADDKDKPYGEREWNRYLESLDEALFAEGAPCKDLGLSGAQHGAAANIASVFLKNGHQRGLDMAGKDRLIQVQKTFPAQPPKEEG
jgi:hypothetical protein